MRLSDPDIGSISRSSNFNCRCDEVSDNTKLYPNGFTSKSLSSIDQHYSNKECEALGILHGLEKIHHYCFAKEVCVITDYTLLVAILGKDVAMLS